MLFRSLVASTLLVTACAVDGAGSTATGSLETDSAEADTSTTGPTRNIGQSKFEIRFLTDMIDHHMMAVMMSERCLDKAVHGELRGLCTDIIATQTAEIELMQAWLADWYGIAHEPTLKPGASYGMDKLDALFGEQFEIVFMEEMLRHHEGAVREGALCLSRAYHEELIGPCEGIIATQTAESESMQGWLCDWYGRGP